MLPPGGGHDFPDVPLAQPGSPCVKGGRMQGGGGQGSRGGGEAADSGTGCSCFPGKDER